MLGIVSSRFRLGNCSGLAGEMKCVSIWGDDLKEAGFLKTSQNSSRIADEDKFTNSQDLLLVVQRI